MTEFLLARLAEDEASAKVGAFGWDPRRALAEVEAKRRIVEMHGNGGHQCTDGSEYGGGWYGENDIPCPALAVLASVYSDHADYRQEWKP